MLDKLKKLRADHLLIQHKIVFYPYQELVSDKILEALIQNLRLTLSATEEDIKKLKLVELPVEFSRQAGKTTAIVYTVEFILTWLSVKFSRQIHIGIFAPQIEQAKTDFDRLKVAMRRVKDMIIVDEATEREVKEQENSKTLVLPDGSSCYIAPVTKTSHPESKTLDLMIFEESQDLDDQIVKESIWPIGASTNAPRIYLGTAGTRICHFYRLGQSGKALKLYFEDIVTQRRETYERTNDSSHLIYEQTIRQEIEMQGIDSDEIQRPYFGKWLIGTGNFTTEADLDALIDAARTRPTWQHKEFDCFAGIDTAKHPDSTVVTVIRWNSKINKKELLNWCELHGENYQDQFDIIKEFLSHYRVEAVAIDSTGQGDFMPDMFENNTEWSDEHSGLYRIKFSAVSKDLMYKNLKVSIKELLTTLPKLGTKQAEKFRQQMLDLQQEYKGQLLSVKHPDDPNAHDDYCFIAGTLIKTEKGDVPIEELSIGQKVWTRKGYRPIVKTGNRKAEVITRLGITGTPDHPFFTTEGIKRFDEINVSAKIYMWNEKLSSIEARSITAIQNRKSDSSGFIIGDTTSGKSHLSHYIVRFISTIMGKSREAGLYITKTKILSTMLPATWRPCPEPSISHDIKPRKREFSQLTIYPVMRGRWLPSGTTRQKAENGTENTHTKVSSNTRNYQTVYNLTIAEQPEYLANGVLVHNCDSWALAEWAYARWNEDNNASISIISTEKERKVKHGASGQVEDYWPGEDNF